jgi:ribosome-associated protein
VSAERMGRRSDDVTDTCGEALSEAGAAAQTRPSRSARKRHAIALQKLGVRLIHLKSAQLHSLALPEELLDAVLEAQRLRSRPALSRQQQYIGRLMRQIDPAPIEQALDATLRR